VPPFATVSPYKYYATPEDVGGKSDPQVKVPVTWDWGRIAPDSNDFGHYQRLLDMKIWKGDLHYQDKDKCYAMPGRADSWTITPGYPFGIQMNALTYTEFQAEQDGTYWVYMFPYEIYGATDARAMMVRINTADAIPTLLWQTVIMPGTPWNKQAFFRPLTLKQGDRVALVFDTPSWPHLVADFRVGLPAALQ